MNDSIKRNRHFKAAAKVIALRRYCKECSQVPVVGSGEYCVRCRDVVARRDARTAELLRMRNKARAASAIVGGITLLAAAAWYWL